MKNLVVAFFYTLFVLTVPLVWANATAQEISVSSESSSQNQVEDENQSTGITISVDMDDDSDEVSGDIEADKVAQITDGLGKIFGDEFKKELESELRDLSEEDRKELNEKLKETFEGKKIDLHGNNLGLGATLVAIIAVCLTLGLPVIILLIVFIFSQKKRRQKMELVGMYIKADQPVPDHVMADYEGARAGDQRFYSGVRLILIGVAIMAVLGALAGNEAVLGLFPVAIGLSRIITWWYDKKQENNLSISADH